MLAAGVVSCQQHDDIPQGVKYPILFDSPDTRATATIDDLKDNGFMVYAYVEGNVGSTSFAKKVTHSVVEGRDIWALETPEYWLPDTDYCFKAFYPSVPSAGTLTVVNTNENQSFAIEGYDITKQEDIMVASATASVEAGAPAPASGSVVPLEFEHLLANVTIKAKSQIDGVSIQKIVISRADTNSTYNGSAWNLSGNTTTIEYSQPTTLTKGAEFVDVTNGGILVIPANANNKTLTIQANKTYNLDFPTGTWESGKKYTYTLEIKQDDIIFVDDAPYVEEWDSENATGSVIIK
jgi:hypothetical protein